MSRNLHHFTFSPKYRRPILTPPVFAEVKHHIEHICGLKGIELAAISTDEDKQDHIHILAMLPQDMSPAKAMRLIKWYSSIHTRRKYPKFKWQRKYWSGTVGGGRRAIEKYIAAQGGASA